MIKNLTLEYKPDFERAVSYWDAFWAHEMIDRPCAIVYARKKNDAYPPGPMHGADRDYANTMTFHDKHLACHEFLGEAIPFGRLEFGPDQMAGFLGAPLVLSEDRKTSWSKKIVDDWSKFLPLKLDDSNQCWNRMKEFHKIASDHYKGKCLIANIDLHSNIDTLEGLRGAEKLLFDLIDDPDQMLRIISDVRKVYKKIYDEFYKYGNKKVLGTISSWLPFYSRGKFNPVQADFISLLSPEMIRKFVLPAIEEEAQFLDNSCFHLDGQDALKHLDDILAVKEIDAVQWVHGVGNKPQLEWVDLLQKIQSAGKAVILYGTVEQLKAFHGTLRPELVVYQTWADSVEQGQGFIDWLKENT